MQKILLTHWLNEQNTEATRKGTFFSIKRTGHSRLINIILMIVRFPFLVINFSIFIVFFLSILVLVRFYRLIVTTIGASVPPVLTLRTLSRLLDRSLQFFPTGLILRWLDQATKKYIPERLLDNREKVLYLRSFP